MLSGAGVATKLTPLLGRFLGPRSHVAIEFWDGSVFGDPSSRGRIAVRSPDALRRIVQAPGELGFERAYVAGDLDVVGDIYDALALQDLRSDLRLGLLEWTAALRAALSVGALSLRRLEPPPEEARLHGRLHTRARDAAAISYHYDVSNDFYRIVLGPSLTYSCAYFASPSQSLEDAQRDKHELICRKLRLRDGERLLDVGCGWGDARDPCGAGARCERRRRDALAQPGGARRQACRRRRARRPRRDPRAGRARRRRRSLRRDLERRMFEHVGAPRLAEYFDHLYALLRPQGRLLNHGISRPPGRVHRRGPRKGFIDSYVFPDGELHEVGRVVSFMQDAGFEVRDIESLREHYALTLRRWVANLEADRTAAVALAGEGRYRVWRLYMAASALNFEAGRTQVHQVLGVRGDGGTSGVPLRRADAVLA